ncbi:MAG: hypothetical protein JKX92_05445 [Porticoccaceae bacterium]|nr:hypothetical protein [Porticoccaceae bacterium]
MTISDTDYQIWLTDIGQQRTILVEMHHAAGVEYIANVAYISLPTDTNANRIYDDVLNEAVDIESRLDGDYSLGEITIINDGSLNTWLANKWAGHEIRLYLGAKNWSLDDFRRVALAVNGGIDDVSPGVIRFAIRDPKALFDQSLQNTLLPSGLPAPITLGQPFNVLPALTDDSTHEYQVNDDTITSALVRDNGVVVSHITDYANGKYTLTARPQGNLGVDVIEANTTAKEIINWVCTRQGKTAVQTTLNALPTYAMGLHYNNQLTAEQVLDDVCLSIGAYWRVNAAGEVEVHQLVEPAMTADLVITADDMLANGLRLVSVEPPIKTLTMNYDRNFGPVSRNSLAGMLDSNPTLAEKLTANWQQVTATNVLTEYPLAADQTIDSYIVGTADVQTECDRIAALRGVRREVWAVECFLAPAQIHVQQTVQLFNPRFGFATGKNALVIAVNRGYTRNKVELEVWL